MHVFVSNLRTLLLILISFSLVSCIHLLGGQRIEKGNSQPEALTAEECPPKPQGALIPDTVQLIELNRQQVSLTGTVREGDYRGFQFPAEKGQILEYNTEDDICIWIFTPDNQLLEGIELPMDGTYTIQLSASRGTQTFKLLVSMGHPEKIEDSSPGSATHEATPPIAVLEDTSSEAPSSPREFPPSEPPKINEERVQFESGSTGATLQGTVSANKYVRYLLWCQQGQNMELLLQEGNFQITIFAPDGQVIGNVMVEEGNWQTELPANGDYVLEISSNKETNYRFSVEVL